MGVVLLQHMASFDLLVTESYEMNGNCMLGKTVASNECIEVLLLGFLKGNAQCALAFRTIYQRWQIYKFIATGKKTTSSALFVCVESKTIL